MARECARVAGCSGKAGVILVHPHAMENDRESFCLGQAGYSQDIVLERGFCCLLLLANPSGAAAHLVASTTPCLQVARGARGSCATALARTDVNS